MNKTIKRCLELEKLMGVDTIIPPKITAKNEKKPEIDKSGEINLSLEQKLELIEQEVKNCTHCKLHETRIQGVFARGNPRSNLMLIGEAPGADEDKQGKPFVGRAGKLLDKMLLAVGLDENDYYITNIIKSRPPHNRDPHRDEIDACRPYLNRQIEIISPDIIVTLGLPASQTLLESTSSMGDLRGKWFEYKGIPVLPIYHPAYLLRSPGQKGIVWQDLKKLCSRL